MTVYRTDDNSRWGAGKGSNLTPAEVDLNFWDIIQRLVSLETNPPSAISIDTITVAGNQMTVHLTDGSTRGPFTLPTAQWRWTGAWRTSTVYFVNDIFSFDGAIYRVAVSHTSDATAFDPNALSGSGYVYNLLLNPPVQPYDLGMFYSFAIPVDGTELLQHVAARSFVVPPDFLQSVAFLRVAATTQTLTFALQKNDDTIGHLEFVPGSNTTSDGGQFGTFIPLSPADDIQFDHGDRFKVFAPELSPPTPDDTAAGLSVTIAARTGTISNTIVFYPRPLRVIEPATVVNGNEFGSPILRHTLFLSPSAVGNAQSFGAQQLAVIRRYLRPAAVVNAQSFGDNQVELRSRTYLNSTALANASTFGSHKFKKKLLETMFTNVSTFGAHAIASAVKKYSYSNPLGSGNRTGTITVTLGGVTAGGGSASQVVNGSTANEFWWNTGTNATLKFDLGSAKVIKQARWKQSNGSTHGTFKWQGSNDDSIYTDIGGTFTLGGTTVQVHTSLIDNATAYRHYRLTQTAGSTSNSPFLQEVEFYIEGTTKNLPDGSYRYPCGGGSDAGGDVSGVGGSGVDRSSLITVTAGYTVASAGQNAQNWVDGGVGNNTTDSVDFASGQTAITIKFDFQGSGKKQRIVGLSISQSNGTGQGTYTFEASNDNTNWTALATGIAWLTDINANGTNFTFTNTSAYRHYRLRQTGGSTASSPWIQEIFFKCAPSPYAADAL